MASGGGYLQAGARAIFDVGDSGVFSRLHQPITTPTTSIGCAANQYPCHSQFNPLTFNSLVPPSRTPASHPRTFGPKRQPHKTS
ncbi:hypothetical protein VTL71DRAFT_9069 [Oculimacula yallundae]|uniref:Uncharacterized protein n=1 Tax=Oculimacula yallundae TaxID=86028 RepID=A0ABR4BTN6_9HELO